MQKTTVTVLDRLNRVISAESHAANPNDRVQISDLQSLLCATLQVCFASMIFHESSSISLSERSTKNATKRCTIDL